MTLRIHTTARCRNTPRVLFALEEASAPYEVVVRDDGWFQSTHGRLGPILEEGTLQLFEVNAILRYVARTRAPALWPSMAVHEAEADMWMDYALTGLRPALIRLVASRDDGARSDLAAVLRVIDRAVSERAWLAGTMSVADLAYASLALFPAVGGVSAELPSFSAWLARLADRPAWQRALARMEAEGEGRSS